MNDNQPAPPVSELLSLAGQRALVTGASGNIGRAIAMRLAEAGADVLVHYRNDDEGAAQSVAGIIAGGGTATAVQADLSTDEGVAELFRQIDERGPAVTSVVNNAGMYEVQNIEKMTGDEWRESLSANLDSAFRVSQAAARRMLDHRVSGAVVNIASIEGSDPAVGHAHYSSAKAGLLMLTRASAMEHGANGIRFNAVSPGLIDRRGIAENWPDGVARWQQRVPLGRMGQADEVAIAVLFLLSPAAAWISGAEIKVDGGMSAVSRW